MLHRCRFYTSRTSWLKVFGQCGGGWYIGIRMWFCFETLQMLLCGFTWCLELISMGG